MAKSLAAFMAQSSVKVNIENAVISKRFKDESGKPMEWQIGAITSEEDEKLRKLCTRKVQVPGKREKFTIDLDVNKYLGLMAAKCVLYPDLNNANLQDSYGVTSADTLLKTMLLPGEYANCISKIKEINGFDEEMDDVVEEAKN